MSRTATMMAISLSNVQKGSRRQSQPRGRDLDGSELEAMATKQAASAEAVTTEQDADTTLLDTQSAAVH